MNRDIDTRGLAVLVGLSIGTVLLVSAALAEATDEDLSSWVASIATVAAFAAAVVAAWYASRVYGVETARERRVEDQERRGQASLVAAWGAAPTFERGVQDEMTGELFSTGINGAQVFLRNASEVPVTGATVTVFMEVTWASGQETYRLGSTFVDTVPPGGTAKTVMVHANHRVFDFQTYGVIEEELTCNINVEMSFRDSAGVEWSRSTEGVLLEVRQSEAPPGVDSAPRD